MAKLSTQEILNLDYRVEENRKIIQKCLRVIKPLAKCPEDEDVPQEMLERAFLVICRKYNFFPRTLLPDVYAADKEIIWRVEIHDLTNLKTCGACYGASLYELIAKAVIMAYALSKQKVGM